MEKPEIEIARLQQKFEAMATTMAATNMKMDAKLDALTAKVDSINLAMNGGRWLLVGILAATGVAGATAGKAINNFLGGL